jgi:hypothetical protein
MAEPPLSPTKALSFEQLAVARRSTQAVSDFLKKRILGYLDTLRTLLLPERFLGRLAGSKFDVPGADKALLELQEVTSLTHPGLSSLPLVVIQSQIPTFLPPESVIAAATELSGIDAFIELIDLEAIRELPDPFRQRVSQFIPGQL